MADTIIGGGTTYSGVEGIKATDSNSTTITFIKPSGTKSITSNGTGIDISSYASADVAVPNSYSAGDEGKVVSNGALVAQSSDTVTVNDTYDTTLINSLTVNVSGGGIDWDGFVAGTEPTGAIVLDTTTQITTVRRFAGLTGITSLSAPLLTSITGSDTFTDCNGLISIYVPELTTIPLYCFLGCKHLESVHFPKLTTIGQASFQYAGQQASGEVILVFPAVTTISGGDAFRSINDYATVDLGSNLTNLPVRTFYNHSFKGVLILRSSAVVTCANSNSIASLVSGATVYVPQALISSYQTETNWSAAYAAGVTFAAIEGSQYDGYYADGTQIPTT